MIRIPTPARSAGGLCCALVLSLLATVHAAWAQPVTAIWYQGEPDSLAGTTEVLLQAPASAITAHVPFAARVTVNVGGFTGFPRLDLTMPGNQPFAAGAFEEADDPGRAKPHASLDLTLGTSACSGTGRFTVLESVITGSTVERLAVNIEHRCAGSAAATFVEVRINSSWPLTFQKPANSTTPDAFAFRPRYHLPPSTLVESNVTTIYGINAPAPIQVTGGGEYSVNGGPFTSAPGTVSNRDHVRVRATSSATPGATVTPTLDVGGVTAPFLVETYGPADRLTGLALRSDAADPVGRGRILEGFAPQWALWTGSVFTNYLNFGLDGPMGIDYSLAFGAGEGRQLTAGASYELASSDSGGNGPHLSFGGDGVGCGTTARFVVLEYNLVGGALDRLAVNFQNACGDVPPTFGEIRYNSRVPLTSQKPAGSLTPDPFAFIAGQPAVPGAQVVSNWIGITGLSAPVPLTITGGEYSVNGGAFTSAAGTARNGDVIKVRLVASRFYGSTVMATLAAGGRSAHFVVTTASQRAPANALSFRSAPGDWIGKGATKTFDSSLDRFSAQRMFNGGVQISVDSQTGENWTLWISSPNGGGRPSPGTFTGARRAVSAPPGTPGLDFSGNGAGCNDLAGRFIVHEAVYEADGSVRSFAVDFEQRCEVTGPLLVGEIRFNSTVPYGIFADALARAQRTDLDGDGRTDILWKSGDIFSGWLMNGLVPKAYAWIVGPGSGVEVKLAADFDGDGRSDLIGVFPDGTVAVWMMNGLGIASTRTVLGPGTGWVPLRTGDFNGDGRADLLWRNAYDGSYSVWIMNGSAPASYGIVFGPGNGIELTHVADFDGDGRADLLGIRPDGIVTIWLMNGSSVVSSAMLMGPSPNWTPVLVADWTGDGKQDILWKARDGAYGLLTLDGWVPIENRRLLDGGTGWSPTLATDLDGDGRADIVWTHANGTVSAWLMYGSTFSYATLLGPATGWSVVGSGDYDGDGMGDLLWRSTEGTYSVWLMEGLTRRSAAWILGPYTGWEAVKQP